jgi:hypothetical protein
VEKQFEHNDSSSPPQAEPDIAAVLKRIQQQLTFLEKKIDTLISRSPERPSGGQRFSKPFRSHNRPYHHDKRKHYAGSREGGFDRERHFGKKQGSGNQGFSRGGHFDRGEGGGNQRFSRGKKPFYGRRKERS